VEEDIYLSLLPIFAQAGVPAVPVVKKVERAIERKEYRNKGQEKGMLAYILMKVPGKDVEDLLERLKDFQEIQEASTLYGESDVILKVQVKDQDQLDRLVMEKLHGLPMVESTRTFIVIGHLHWRREEKNP
jgi:DNA-binding Lrp family transcriptional regulator